MEKSSSVYFIVGVLLWNATGGLMPQVWSSEIGEPQVLLREGFEEDPDGDGVAGDWQKWDAGEAYDRGRKVATYSLSPEDPKEGKHAQSCVAPLKNTGLILHRGSIGLRRGGPYPGDRSCFVPRPQRQPGL